VDKRKITIIINILDDQKSVRRISLTPETTCGGPVDI
jgi:hypothetical protein